MINFLIGDDKHDLNLLKDAPSVLYQILFALVAAVFGVLAQILMNLSLKYEGATKVTLIRSTELVFSFLFQYLLLNINANLYSVLGSVLILVATLLTVFFQFLKKIFKKVK